MKQKGIADKNDILYYGSEKVFEVEESETTVRVNLVLTNLASYKIRWQEDPYYELELNIQSYLLAIWKLKFF